MSYWKIINNNVYLCENKRQKSIKGESKIDRKIIFKAGHIDFLDDTILDKLMELKEFIRVKKSYKVR